MKKLLVLFLLTISLPTFSQRVDKPGEEYEHYVYVRLIPSKLDCKAVIVLKSGERYDIVDADGKKKIFDSEIDVINYMTQRGWTFVENILFPSGLVFKKKIKTFEEAKEYLDIKK